MKIFDYHTTGGKNLILDFINKLPNNDKDKATHMRNRLIMEGLNYLEKLDTRQLKGKMWEIKITQSRYMYVIVDKESIFFVHACKKQKGKAEKFELEKALERAKKGGLL